MSWDRQAKRLSCDAKWYVQPPGTSGASDGYYQQCSRFVEADLSAQARVAARELHWQRQASHAEDRCPQHAIRPRRRKRS